MKKIILVALSLAVFIVAGCGGAPDDPEQDRKIVAYYNVQQLSLSGTSSKSETEEAENMVNRIIFYGIDRQNTVSKLLTEQNPTFGSTEITVSQDILSIFAVANPSSGIELATPQNLADLTDMVAEFANMPATPFIMSGIAVIFNNVANIELIRTIAKIEFLPSSELVIETVTVTNTPNQGYVFGRGSAAVPPTASRISYPQIASATPIIYVAENTASDPTAFVVTGTFEGNPARYEIPFEIEKGVSSAISRNTHYQIPIMPISEDACIVNITVLPWNVVVTDAYEPDDD